MNKGKVYIAGAGCGDLELITLKLKKVLERADCIVYDRLVNNNILNYAKDDAELIYYGKENTEGGLIQDKINEVLVKKAKEGKNVVRLKGGDPFVFGRGGEEILELVNEGIEFEVIPGITSAIAVPEYAGIPVSHRGINTSFHIFTGHTQQDGKWIDFSVVGKLEGTLIFLMGIKNLEKIVNGLTENGKDIKTPVAVIENGTTGKQKVTTGCLENIVKITQEKNVKSPAVIIIGKVVDLREKMKWFENKKLFGKTILVTRNKEQAYSVSEQINELGGETLELPFINIEYKDFDIPDFTKYKGILFNSANSVRGFFRKIKDVRILGNIKIGAVGIKTYEELEKNKIIPDFFPTEYRVEMLAKEMLNYTHEDDEILIVTSNISPVSEKVYSEKYNRKFRRLEVYNTEKILQNEKEVEEYISKSDIITFLSTSTFESFMESINFRKELLKNKIIASIGPMTSMAIKKYGIKVDVEACEYTVEGLISKIN